MPALRHADDLDEGVLALPGLPLQGRLLLSRRSLPGGYEVDDDRARVDRAAVHDFVCFHAYWALGRAREVQDELIETAARDVGVYRGAEQVGFCRAVADRHTVAYLADVYILPAHRGHGLGRELVAEMVDNWPYGPTKWLLHTADAHELYRSYGFTDPGVRLMERWPAGEGALPQAGDGPGGEAD